MHDESVSASSETDSESEEEDEDDADYEDTEIKVTHVYRSKKSIEKHKYNYFFIDERKKNSKTKHFVLFINEYKSDESKKTNGIELNLNQFFPLNSEDASQKLLNLFLKTKEIL
jgi:hypothetical protein